MKTDVISFNELWKLLHYDPITGKWTRRIATGRHGCHRAGSTVGALNNRGYVSMRIGDRLYLSHRLAWLYMTGEWPNSQVDHINLKRDDNRWENLRAATHGQNVQNSSLRKNNSSGFKGVKKMKTTYTLKRPFTARITIDRKEINLGYFSTASEAGDAYLQAAKVHFGEFAREK